jgi:hypothetical protein
MQQTHVEKLLSETAAKTNHPPRRRLLLLLLPSSALEMRLHCADAPAVLAGGGGRGAAAQPGGAGAAADRRRPAQRHHTRQGQHGQQQDQRRPARATATAGRCSAGRPFIGARGYGQSSRRAGAGAGSTGADAGHRPGSAVLPAAAGEPELLQRGGEPRAQPRTLGPLLGAAPLRGGAPLLIDRVALGE